MAAGALKPTADMTRAARRLLDNPLVRQTTAWQKSQVVQLTPAIWYLVSGGIQATQMMVDEIAAAYAKT